MAFLPRTLVSSSLCTMSSSRGAGQQAGGFRRGAVQSLLKTPLVIQQSRPPISLVMNTSRHMQTLAAFKPSRVLGWAQSFDKKGASSPPSDDGSDLFAQAKAASDRNSAKSDGQPSSSKAEDEKMRKWREAAQKDQAKRVKRSSRLTLALLTALLVGGYGYLGLPTDPDAQAQQPGESDWNYHNRMVKENVMEVYKYWTNPVSEKLLPDPLPAPYQRAYTLCIELNDSLVHLVWDRALGWRAATRPGVNEFLANLGRYYEIVLFTTTPGYLADPVANALDPFRYALYRLYREHTKLVDGVYVKDISTLNRDPSKVILVDTHPEPQSAQPENGFLIKPWEGSEEDRELPKLQTFFEELFVLMAMTGVNDVRPLLKVLKAIDPNDIPTAWAVHKQRLREDFAQHQKKLAAAAPQPAKPSMLASLVTGRRVDTSASLAQSQNIIDLLESSARQERAAFQKDLEESRAQLEEMQRQQEEAFHKMAEEQKAKKLKLWDYFMGAGVSMEAPPPSSSPSSQPSSSSTASTQ